MVLLGPRNGPLWLFFYLSISILALLVILRYNTYPQLDTLGHGNVTS